MVSFKNNVAPNADFSQRSSEEPVSHALLMPVNELDRQSIRKPIGTVVQEMCTNLPEKEEWWISRLKPVTPPTSASLSPNTGDGQSRDVKQGEALTQVGELQELVGKEKTAVASINAFNRPPGNTTTDLTRQALDSTNSFGHWHVGVPLEERCVRMCNDESNVTNTKPLAIAMSVPKLKGFMKHKEKSSVKPPLHPKPRSLQKKK